MDALSNQPDKSQLDDLDARLNAIAAGAIAAGRNATDPIDLPTLPTNGPADSTDATSDSEPDRSRLDDLDDQLNTIVTGPNVTGLDDQLNTIVTGPSAHQPGQPAERDRHRTE